jgi:hypothetical protein
MHTELNSTVCIACVVKPSCVRHVRTAIASSACQELGHRCLHAHVRVSCPCAIEPLGRTTSRTWLNLVRYFGTSCESIRTASRTKQEGREEASKQPERGLNAKTHKIIIIMTVCAQMFHFHNLSTQCPLTTGPRTPVTWHRRFSGGKSFRVGLRDDVVPAVREAVASSDCPRDRFSLGRCLATGAPTPLRYAGSLVQEAQPECS